MSGPILIDLTHTAHSGARTGVQRVSRGLWRQLGPTSIAVTHDPFEGLWRPLLPWEVSELEKETPGGKRGARWPRSQQWRSRLRRFFGSRTPLPSPASGLIVPEIFSAPTGAALPSLFARVNGPRVAIFHDAISLQLPELSPAGTVSRFPAYLRELARFDAVAANSEASRASLRGYWDWLGLRSAPPIVAIPLGVEPAAPGDTGPSPSRRGGPPVILSVGTIEGRKNHLALLEACESLWSRGLRFQLRLIGLPQRETGIRALERIAALQGAGRPLRFQGAADPGQLEAAYAESSFTVYPSIREGFGLPVAESLLRGKPCVCSNAGALAEIAAGGGCLLVDTRQPAQIAEACQRLLGDERLRSELAEAALRRRFKTPAEYGRELVSWMANLSPSSIAKTVHSA